MREYKRNIELKVKRPIGIKIVFFVIAIVFIVTGSISSIVMKSFGSSMEKQLKDRMRDVASTYRSHIEEAMSKEEDNDDFYKKQLEGIKLTGVDSSYLYLVSDDGTMLYHPTEEKIGQPVENSVVKEMISKISRGEKVEDSVVSYLFKGKTKYAGCATLSNHFILVVSADQDDIFTPIRVARSKALTVAVILLVITIVIAVIVSAHIGEPLKKITVILKEIAQCRFGSHTELIKYSKRNDEVGMIICAVQEMRGNLQHIVNEIDSSCQVIEQNTNKLDESSKNINSACLDNSATTQELAAGMEQTTASTNMINAQIMDMKDQADKMLVISKEGTELSERVISSAEHMKETTSKARENTQATYEDVRVKTKKAISQADAVDQINDLTETIKSISSQTSLLALNASIEAARAGEAGKGFAVVAMEIGKLASQTAQSIEGIENITVTIKEVVQSMADSLSESSDFLENTVLVEYDHFNKMSEQYELDALSFKKEMDKMGISVEQLTANMDFIVTSVDEINCTIQEAAKGVNDMAEKVSHVSIKASDNFSSSQDNVRSVEKMREVMNVFQFE